MCDFPGGCRIKSPTFNFPGEKKGKRCKAHCEEGMVDVKNKKCDYKDEFGKQCTKQPKNGFPGEKSRRCATHSLDGMVDVVSKKCEYVGKNGEKCSKKPNFGYPGKKVSRCGEHTLPDMIDLRHKKCDFVHPETLKKCTTRPSFGLPGQSPTRCAKHKLSEMWDVVSDRCDYLDESGKCAIRPTFGNPGEKATRCKKHKLDGMIDLKHVKCEFKNCFVRPTFNVPGSKTAKFCKQHATENMIDVMNNKCEHPGCLIQPSCNYEGSITSVRCTKHKLDGMVSVISRRLCDYPNCKVTPLFNYPGVTIPIKCGSHKLEGMIDVKHLICEKCNTRAHFGYSCNVPTRCFKHKEIDMVDSIHKKCELCSENAYYGPLFGLTRHCPTHKTANEFRKRNPICEDDDCLEKAFYTNDETNYPIRCEIHKQDDDINIIEKECSNCNLTYFLNEKTGLCNDCNDYVVKRVHKAKEKETVLFLKENGIEFMSEDKIPTDGCSRYRPDAVIDYNSFLVIVEIDEHQHNGYTQKCELTRMMQLHQDYGGIPVIFVRFNPDNYKVYQRNTDVYSSGINYKIQNEQGNKVIIKPSKKRLYELLDLLNRFKNLSEKDDNKYPPLSVCYMFYDNYDKPELKEINIFDEVSSF